MCTTKNKIKATLEQVKRKLREWKRKIKWFYEVYHKSDMSKYVIIVEPEPEPKKDLKYYIKRYNELKFKIKTIYIWIKKIIKK